MEVKGHATGGTREQSQVGVQVISCFSAERMDGRNAASRSGNEKGTFGGCNIQSPLEVGMQPALRGKRCKGPWWAH